MQERMNEMEEPHRKRLNDLLTPDQRNRMQEVILQVECSCSKTKRHCR